nr:TatD family hydrolase [Tessaracoccus coleopterorum]
MLLRRRRLRRAVSGARAWLSFPGSSRSDRPEPSVKRRSPPPRPDPRRDRRPYLTPKPCRGRANAPYLLPHTVRFLADLLGVDLARFCDQIVTNTFNAYGKWGTDA